ncbi:hypothetical protein ACMBCM_08600 [Spiroplasma sp. K1]
MQVIWNIQYQKKRLPYYYCYYYYYYYFFNFPSVFAMFYFVRCQR